MAKLNLKQKLAAIATISLNFTGLSFQKDREGKMIAILQLSEPIALVRGSQEIEIDGIRRPVVAHDVTEVKVHEDDFNEDFVFDDKTDTGEYKGSDLMLDVAQRGGVWLKATSFAQGSQAFRTKARNDRLRQALGIPDGTKANPVKAPNTPNTGDLKPVDTTKPVK